jgi:hypothetical protein
LICSWQLAEGISVVVLKKPNRCGAETSSASRAIVALVHLPVAAMR